MTKAFLMTSTFLASLSAFPVVAETVTNTDTITTTNDYDYGVNLRGDDGTITNSGTVTTSGEHSHGARIWGSRGTITNSGSITTSGDHSHGAQLWGPSAATMTNTGSITTTGAFSNGVLISSNGGTTIANTGSIAVSGNNADAISSVDDDLVITNSGSLIAENGNSISLVGYNATVTLEEGSVVVGVMDLGYDATLNINGNQNGMFEVETRNDSLTINATSSYVYSNDVLYVVDADAAGLGLAGDLGFATGDLVRDTVFSNIGGSRGAVVGDWGDVVGRVISTTDDNPYILSQTGFVIGNNGADGGGYFAAIIFGDLRGKDGTDFDATSTGFSAGKTWVKDANTTLSLVAGFTMIEADRMITDSTSDTGFTDITSTYTSYFVNPSAIKDDVFDIEGSQITFGYTAAYTPSYTENGSGAALTVDNSWSHRLDAGFGMSHELNKTLELRYGADATYAFGGADAITLAGEALSIDTDGGLSARGYVGLDLGTGSTRLGRLEIGYDTDGTLDATLGIDLRF